MNLATDVRLTKQVCVANCDRKAYCDPGNYTTQFAEVSKCPLNVCCSKWGYCGLTEEFCGTKKVKRPSCDKKGSVNRVVGYYEGWSLDRSCNAFAPEQIPVGIYTHLNYAFASIDPDTFEVRPTSRKDHNLYRRLVALKQRDPDLKVFIAIGCVFPLQEIPSFLGSAYALQKLLTRVQWLDFQRSRTDSNNFFRHRTLRDQPESLLQVSTKLHGNLWLRRS
jgi:hypothetical protein